MNKEKKKVHIGIEKCVGFRVSGGSLARASVLQNSFETFIFPWRSYSSAFSKERLLWPWIKIIIILKMKIKTRKQTNNIIGSIILGILQSN